MQEDLTPQREPSTRSRMPIVQPGGIDTFSAFDTFPRIDIPSCKSLHDGQVVVLDDDASIVETSKMLYSRIFRVNTEAFSPFDLPEVKLGQSRSADIAQAMALRIAAIARDPQRRVSLLVTDFSMKIVTGGQVLAALHEELGNPLPFKVIVNSGQDLPNMLDTGIKFTPGEIEFLAKPPELSSIKNLISALFPEA